MSKRLPWIRLLLLVLVLTCAGGAAAFLCVSRADLQPFLQRELSKALGRPLAVGEVRLRFFPTPALDFKDIAIESPGEVIAAAHIPHLHVQPEFLPLLQGKLLFNKITLQSPLLKIDLAHLGNGDAAAGPERKNISGPIKLKTLRLRQGNLTLIHSTDSRFPSPLLIPNVNGRLVMKADHPLILMVDGELSMDGVLAPFSGDFSWAGGDAWRRETLSGKLQLTRLPLPFLVRRIPGWAAVQAAGNLDIALRVQGTPAAARSGLAVAAPHANSIILVGPAALLTEYKALIARLDVDMPTGRGHLHAVPLQYLKADEAAKSLSALLEKAAAKATDGKGIRRIAVESSPANNALLVDASPNDFETVRALLEQLDRAPEQVHIRVLIAEVSASAGFTWGVGLTALTAPGDAGDTAVSAGSRMAANTGSLVEDAARGVLPQGLTAAISHARRNADGTLRIDYPGIISIEALRESGDVEILSETALQAQNNTEATLSIVDEIPILKSTIEGGSGTARDVIQNIERQEVGVKLKLVPHVIPGGLVRMDLNPSIESVISSGSGTTEFTPTIAKRTANTTVTVPDGQTIVIAGLTRKDKQKIDHRLPLLGDIPVLGWLFRYTREVEKTANLLILVTPTILHEPGDAAGSTQAWRLRTGIHDHAEAPDAQQPGP